MKDRSKYREFIVTASTSYSSDEELLKLFWLNLKTSFFNSSLWEKIKEQYFSNKEDNILENQVNVFTGHLFEPVDLELILESGILSRVRFKGVRSYRLNPLQNEILLVVGYVNLTPGKTPGFMIEDNKITELIISLQISIELDKKERILKDSRILSYDEFSSLTS